MAVVRAGDAEPDLLEGEIPAPPTSQPSQSSLVSSAKAEPFALAEDYSVTEGGDRATPIMIPPPPAVPIDLIQRSFGNYQPSKELAPLAQPPTNPEPPKQPHTAAVQAAGGPVQDIDSNRPLSAPRRAESDSVATREPGTSNRRKYSLVAVALASLVIAAAVLALVNGGNHDVSNASARLQTQVVPASQQPALPKLIDAPPTAHETNDPAPQQVAAAQSAGTPPSSSAAPAASAPGETTRVTLDLSPIDARVLYLGREVPGPPFVFEIGKGQRMAIEVLRFGFATAKVVLDDKKPLVHFGMLREHKAKPAARHVAHE